MESPKLTTFLWFDSAAEEAAKTYTSIFPNSSITHTTHYLANSAAINNRPVNSVMSLEFKLSGHPFIALNGGPIFKFSTATSFMIDCEDQEEVDYYWEKLSLGGDVSKQRCGWVEDRFGVTWQVIPRAMTEMLKEGTVEQKQRITGVMMKMGKLEVGGLRKAFEGVEE